MARELFYATGKRKCAVARTWVGSGTGNVLVNGKELDAYFDVRTARSILRQPLVLTDTEDSVDVEIKVMGGGFLGQAGAARHGIAKALAQYDPKLRGSLKKNGFITRDSRIKERKKYGQKGARARFQFSKR